MKSLRKFLRGKDQFGVPLSFTHNNDKSFKTVLGGVVTIASVVGLLVYFALLVNSALNKQRSTLVNSEYFRNLVFDGTNVELNEDSFDFAVRLDTFNPAFDAVNDVLEEYFSVSGFHEEISYKENYT